MIEILKKLSTLLNEGQPAVLVTVVASSGSTPRGAGARMLVWGAGLSMGTIGGGAVELRAQQMAQTVLGKGECHLEHFILAPNEVADLGMICGGNTDVLFQSLLPTNSNTIRTVRNIQDCLIKDNDAWLVTELTDGTYWKLFSSENVQDSFLQELLKAKAACVVLDGKRYYVEHLVQAGKVYIFGGGHIAQELTPVLSRIGFSCIVLDDREAFVMPELFPGVQETKLLNFESISDTIHLRASDWIIIVTRGHQNDFVVLTQALRSNVCYIGMIGSHTKVRKTQQRLLDGGYTQADIDRIYAPIGLNISAETPSEIAISIAGQMIQVRAALQRKS